MSLTRKGRDRLNDEEVHRRKELQELFGGLPFVLNHLQNKRLGVSGS